MFDKFCDYMYYLLTTPFKRVKKSLNQWYIFCLVFGHYFDDAMESLYKAGEQTMVATCSPELLSVQAEERGMTRYQGESDDNFRKRIANYAEVCRLGGSDEGILLAVRTLGFDNVSIIKAKELENSDERWAEFYIIININPDDALPIGYDVLRQQVRKVKYTTALDNYQLVICLPVNKVNDVAARSIFRCINDTVFLSKDRTIVVCKALTEMHSEVYIDIKQNLWCLNGQYSLDGSKALNAIKIWEEI